MFDVPESIDSRELWFDQPDCVAGSELQIENDGKVDHDHRHLRIRSFAILGAREIERGAKEMLGFVERVDTETFLTHERQVFDGLVLVISPRIVMR